MPIPQGLLAFGAGSSAFGGGGGYPGFGGGFGSVLGALSQGQQLQSQRRDQQLQNILDIARFEQEIRSAEQKQAQALSQQQAAGALRQEIPDHLRTLFDVDQATAIDRAFPETPDPTSLQRNLQGAGLEPGTQQYQQAILDAVTKRRQGETAGFKVPSGYQLANPNDMASGVIPIPGGPADPSNPKNFSGEQRKAAGFAVRLENAQDSLLAMEDVGFNPASLSESLRGITGRSTMTEEGRAYRDFQNEFIRAILRKESGAAITEEERESYAAYFPQFGDGQSDILRKAQIRDQLIQGVINESGGAFGAMATQDAAKQQGYSKEDLEFTAKKHGMTVQQVLQALGGGVR